MEYRGEPNPGQGCRSIIILLLVAMFAAVAIVTALILL